MRLISAFSGLPGNCHLTLIGRKTDYLEQVENSIIRHKCNDRISILTSLSDEEMLTSLFNSNFVVFPSLFEGFGMPIIEGLVAGKPVLCSDIPVHKEIAGDHVAYFNPQSVNDIMQILSAAVKGKIEFDLKKNRDWAIKKYSWDNIFDKFIAEWLK